MGVFNSLRVKLVIGLVPSNEGKNSSSWREFENMACSMEEAGEKEKLAGSTMLLATYTSTVEAILYK